MTTKEVARSFQKGNSTLILTFSAILAGGLAGCLWLVAFLALFSLLSPRTLVQLWWLGLIGYFGEIALVSLINLTIIKYFFDRFSTLEAIVSPIISQFIPLFYTQTVVGFFFGKLILPTVPFSNLIANPFTLLILTVIISLFFYFFSLKKDNLPLLSFKKMR